MEGRATFLLALLLVVALPALPAFARPTRHRKSSPRPTHHARRGGRVARGGDDAPLAPGKVPKGADRQKLVLAGRLPPFYDPGNLAMPPVLGAPSAILIDADTGQTLWEKDADAKRFPASTTKILTSLLFIEHTQPGDIVTCTDPKITQIEPSSLHIKPWEKFTAQDLLYGTLIRSGNDGAVVMAEHVAGSIPKFAEMMNARAKQIGTTASHFVTPNGLHDPNHYTTVRDMARIARTAMQNPRFADAVSQPERTITRSIVTQDERIVAHARDFWAYFPGADGVKTGYTRPAGHCFVGSATRDGRRLLSVIFGSRNSATKDTVPTLAWGFDRFASLSIARRGTPEPDVSVQNGTSSTVPTVVDGDLHVSYDTLKPESRPVPTTVVTEDRPVAPIRKGQIVGRLSAFVGGNEVASAPLIATESVPRATNFFNRARGDARPGANGFAAAILKAGGALVLLLVAWRMYAATIAKSARIRRHRLTAARRGDHRGGQGSRR